MSPSLEDKCILSEYKCDVQTQHLRSYPATYGIYNKLKTFIHKTSMGSSVGGIGICDPVTEIDAETNEAHVMG